MKTAVDAVSIDHKPTSVCVMNLAIPAQKMKAARYWISCWTVRYNVPLAALVDWILDHSSKELLLGN